MTEFSQYTCNILDYTFIGNSNVLSWNVLSKCSLYFCNILKYIICYFEIPKMPCAKTSSKLRENTEETIIIIEKACLQFWYFIAYTNILVCACMCTILIFLSELAFSFVSLPYIFFTTKRVNKILKSMLQATLIKI